MKHNINFYKTESGAKRKIKKLEDWNNSVPNMSDEYKNYFIEIKEITEPLSRWMVIWHTFE